MSRKRARVWARPGEAAKVIHARGPSSASATRNCPPFHFGALFLGESAATREREREHRVRRKYPCSLSRRAAFRSLRRSHSIPGLNYVIGSDSTCPLSFRAPRVTCADVTSEPTFSRLHVHARVFNLVTELLHHPTHEEKEGVCRLRQRSERLKIVSYSRHDAVFANISPIPPPRRITGVRLIRRRRLRCVLQFGRRN